MPLDRAVRFVADRVGELAGRVRELARVRHELPRDRVVGIGRIDQPRERWRQAQRIAGGDELEFGERIGPRSARPRPSRWGAGACGQPALTPCRRQPASTSTCSIRSAPRGQHDQPVEAERDAAGRRHRRQRGKEILVDRVALAVEASARRDLRLEPAALLGRVGELAEGVGELDAAGKQLEALGKARIVRL